jgi:DNA repair protein RecO (recombination protein O)
VLRSVDVFETSRVLTLYTRALGKVSALAKGGRRLRSPFRSALDLLSACDVVLLHKGTEALDLLTEAELVERFDAPRRDLPSLYAGYYIAELLGELTDHAPPHPRLYDAAVTTLRHLGDAALRARRVMRFELACLAEMGHRPSWDRCAGCGEPVEAAAGRSVSARPPAACSARTAGRVTPTPRPSRRPHSRRSACWPAPARPGASSTRPRRARSRPAPP